MEQYRQNTQAANIEHQSHEYDGACDHDDNHVSALETLGGHRNMGHWELSHVSTSTVPNPEQKTQRTREHVMDGLVTKNPFIVSDRAKKTQKTHDQIMDDLMSKNPFYALSEAGQEDSLPTVGEASNVLTQPMSENPSRRTWKVKQPTESAYTTSASLSEYPWITKVSQGTRKKWKRRAAIMPPIAEEAELSNVDTGRGCGPFHPEGQSGATSAHAKRVELTIDSGAAEHVVGPMDLPHLPVGPSRKHIQYTMANGHKTSNRGEQHVRAVTKDGHEIAFKAQVTDVHRPLMSVSRICDRGNRVVFENHGGYIESLTTGEKIQVHRDRNVYRLEVSVPDSGFTRQGVSEITYP